MKRIKQSKIIIISVLITLLLLAGMILLIPKAKTANAATIEPNEKLNYTLVTNEDGESSYKVGVKTAYRSQVEFVVIPETYEGLPVTEVAANGFVSCANLTKVILPATVKVLGNNAFMNCGKLQAVSMPNVQSIGTNAFGMCTTLDRLFIPNSVTEVGANILRNNPNTVFVQSSSEVVDTLWSSTWSNYFTGEIVYSVDPEDTIQYREILGTDNSTVIGYEIKEEQYLADIDADVVIYNSVCVDEELGYLPVLNICPEAFLFSQVNSITIRDRHTDDVEAPSFTHKMNIRSNAFLFAIVQEIKIEVGVTFNHPENLQMAYTESMYDGQPILGDADGYSTRIFEESVVKTVTLPAEMDIVTERMFYNCTYLESIKINGAEYDGTNKLPEVQKIGSEAFSSCIALNNITVPESVKYVGEAAFSNLGENTDKQEIYVDKYEDEISDWDSNWAVNNKGNVTISYKPLTYITIHLYDRLVEGLDGFIDGNIGNKYESVTIKLGVKPGRELPEITAAIVRRGYVYNGIYSRANGGGYQYYTDDYKGARVWNEGDPETLYVNWRIVNYTITYVFSDDCSWENNPNPTTYNIEDKFMFVKPDSRDGYTFEWSRVGIEKGTTGNITIIGTWSPKDYYIEYDVDLSRPKNICHIPTNPSNYEAGTEYVFEKYCGVGYTFEWIPAKIDKNTTGNLTVKGIWTPVEYKINYVVWEGTENPNPTKYDVEHNVTFAPATYYGYEVTWDITSTENRTGDITVTAIYNCIDPLISCYNRKTGIYEINNWLDLNEMKYVDTKGKTFHLDVDCEGRVWDPFLIFYGIITGTVRNLKLIPDYNKTEYGFIILNRGTIIDFELDCTVEIKNTLSPYRCVGTICGANGGEVIRCTAKSSNPISYTMPNGQTIQTGILNTVDKYTHIGGLIGVGNAIDCKNYMDIYSVGGMGGIAYNSSGDIINCQNYGTIRYYSIYEVGQNIGGIVGVFFDAEISNCINY
ncbi:MAG: leucine-rich repeat domain-containing protein, partial [Clostridia bacterium]|nr:leucine-rich repeat domain-containing protein [Clostridia bacterium]